jgi:hypothetical protein
MQPMGTATNTSPELSERGRVSSGRNHIRKPQDSTNGWTSHKGASLSCFGMPAVADDASEADHCMPVRLVLVWFVLSAT